MKIEKAKIKTPSDNLNKISMNTISSRASINIFNQKKKGEYYLLNIKNLIPYKNQTRIYFDEKKIEELCNTIIAHGIRQPLTVVKSERYPEKYEIVSGERRFRAAIIAKLESIPCIILEDSAIAEEIAIIENIQRQDLHPLELAHAYSQLYKTEKYNKQNDIAKKLGVPRTHITEYLKFNNFSEDEKKLLIQYEISDRNTLRKLISIKESEKRKLLLNQLINEKGSKLNFGLELRIKKKQTNIVSVFLEEGILKYTLNFSKKLKDKDKQKLKIVLQDIINII